MYKSWFTKLIAHKYLDTCMRMASYININSKQFQLPWELKVLHLQLTTAAHRKNSQSWGQLSSKYTKSFFSATGQKIIKTIHSHTLNKTKHITNEIWEESKWNYNCQDHPSLCLWRLFVEFPLELVLLSGSSFQVPEQAVRS